MREVSEYGLKESFDFKETHISTNHTIPDIHEKILNYIAPTVVELEALELINGFHFILHKEIDFRISSDRWSKSKEEIKEVLRQHNLSDNLKNWGPMPPEPYGGNIGVTLCYNNLEFNSRLILALLDAQKNADDNMKKQLENLIYNQWVHYLYIQYGYKNDVQIQLEFQDSIRWLRTIVSNNSRSKEVIDFANRILDWMKNAIDQLKREFNQ